MRFGVRRAEQSNASVHALSVGEVAQRSGVAVSALHFYEREWLIRSVRTNGNQRRYPRDVLRRVAVIKVAQQTGVPLETVRRALATLPVDRPPSVAEWKRVASWRADLDRRIKRLSFVIQRDTSQPTPTSTATTVVHGERR